MQKYFYRRNAMKNFFLLLVLSTFITFPAIAADQPNACPNCNVTVSPNEYDTPISAGEIKQSSKCSELVDRIFDDRAATYNVLNLTPPQRKLKKTIEERRFQELDAQINVLEQEIYVLKKLQCNPEANKSAIKKQKKVIKNLKKELDKTAKKYDKEFKALLSGEQKSKYNKIQKMKKRDVKRCAQGKDLYKRDPHLQPFGKPYYFDEDACPKHGKVHWFKRKCDITIEEEQPQD